MARGDRLTANSDTGTFSEELRRVPVNRIKDGVLPFDAPPLVTVELHLVALIFNN